MFNLTLCSQKIIGFSLITLPSLVALIGLTAMLDASPSQALPVIVNGVDYVVDVFRGRADQNAAQLKAPSNGGQMLWFGDAQFASDFAAAINSSLGGLNTIMNGHYGPLFAYSSNVSIQCVAAGLYSYAFSAVTDFDCILAYAEYTYAAASLATPVSSVPAPLPGAGAFAAFRVSRRLRHRLRLSL